MARLRAQNLLPRPSRSPAITPVHPDSAGIDVHSEFHFVAVPEDRDPQPVRQFGAFTDELHKLVAWLKACRIRTVAMESTGVYWIGCMNSCKRRASRWCWSIRASSSRCRDASRM